MRQQHSSNVVFCAFDLVDLRRQRFYGARRSKTRKSTLKSLLRGKHAGILFNAHFTRMAQSSTARLAHSAARGVVSKRPNRAMREGSVSSPTSHTSDHFAEARWLSV